ncbi:AraC-type DNA-binding protein [Xylanibacter ruminicola]|uniref:AraC-type DNA-binding protein n=1 Tax=Xylanibacter ruminicola TaxID=839 RepID=A0A1H4B1T5_XYLRU|nr:helix-turn-helix transcriptional regulator [Xylanibacter ruminicola]SEA42100.1 AraC-type DNA-binding protein [Xylanibacter ruminicola]
MRNILKLDSPNDYARFVDAPVLHPLISIIHYDELAPFRHSLNNYGVYGLFIQRQFPNTLSYGMKTLQVSDASIIAVEPGQIGGLEDNGERISLCGWVLLWSPELLHGSVLERQIDRYQFFSYFFDGSLRMEPDEWLCITQLVAQMRQELQTHEDSPSLRSVLQAYLHLILEYCNRIYLRQLSEENRGETDLLKRFQNLLQTYFRENRQLSQGLPTVAWCASQLAYSPRYFGDIVHKVTGGTAIGYIHNYIINRAKSLLMQGHNISETSRLLGFDFPHHFTRLFKRITGLTPSEFVRK